MNKLTILVIVLCLVGLFETRPGKAIDNCKAINTSDICSILDKE